MDGIKLFSLWGNTSEKGTKYFSGKFGENRILAFPVPPEKKSSERAPDMVVYIQAEKKQEDKKFVKQDLDYRTGNPVEADCPF
jgi:hypothetical protein